jgi:hypothetical protein
VSRQESVSVQFEIHGAICHGCNLEIATIHEGILVLFKELHEGHQGFAWLCNMVPEMAGGQLMKISFQRGEEKAQ